MRLQQHNKKYPYIILGIIHLIMVILTFYKSKDRKNHYVLLMNFAGLAYIFEYFIAVLFKGYIYRPKIFKRKEFDNMIGAVLSQYFYVPVTALFITAFQLGWKYKLFFCLCLSLIEKMFIMLSIFEKNWWRTTYTFLLTFLSFMINDKWYKELKNKNPRILFFSYFNMVQVTWMNMTFAFALLKQIRYGTGTLNNHIKFAPIIILPISFLISWWTKTGDFISKMKSLLLMIVTDFILIKSNLYKVKTPLVFPLKYLLFLTMANYYQKLVYKDES
ncbi:hypothetical protein QA612_13650 [Evansella sp. AB-P1]|uniref:hypothetical protein n=1 Tax=Evansella sp. AB-P1 TaxID=3037653 RepID=UPI00241D0702|nr:hypothetical protein [Evansella sp. AB-P1]MDG5788526.1 hypothetical protein [Evansella sp. AB-P1]